MNDVELFEWRAVWRDTAPEAAAAPEELLRLVRRGDRRRWFVALVESLTTLAGIWVLTDVWRHRSGAVWAVWCATVIALFAASWTFALRNRRGTWRASGESVRAFVELAERRSRRRVEAARFAALLLALELAFLIPWGVWEAFASPPADEGELQHRWLRWAFVAATVALFAGWTLYAHRAAERELEAIDDVTRRLTDDGSADH